MLYGRVDYEKKDGSKAAATWGGRMVFDTDLYASSGELKMTHYRVWIVSGKRAHLSSFSTCSIAESCTDSRRLSSHRQLYIPCCKMLLLRCRGTNQVCEGKRVHFVVDADADATVPFQ